MSDPLADDVVVVAFFLADHAAAIDGKVYANGAFWNRLATQSFPSAHHFAVCAVLEVPWLAHDREHSAVVRFEDADGHPVGMRMETRFGVARTGESKAGDSTLIPVTVMVNNFQLERPGDYAAVLEVDGDERARYAFRAHLRD